jgi:hypothetical protein
MLFNTIEEKKCYLRGLIESITILIDSNDVEKSIDSINKKIYMIKNQGE